MTPIQDLLNRIRWDKEFGQGDFVIAYHDRIKNDLVEVALKDLTFPEGEHFSFEFMDDGRVIHSVPLHRIKAVYKDGILIWHREH